MRKIDWRVIAVLGLAWCCLAAARVKTEMHSRAESKAVPKFENIPAPARDDAARDATFTVIDGTPAQQSAGLACLHDGMMPTNDDAPTRNFFFEWGTLEGRLRVDFARTIAIAQINTYSWHKDTRAPQVYKVYGSDGLAKGFDPAPKIGTDPAKCGWAKIAAVDTRPKSGEPGGQHAASISDSAGLIGNYRYLLFEMFVTETDDSWGHTFYSEIDVIER